MSPSERDTVLCLAALARVERERLEVRNLTLAKMESDGLDVSRMTGDGFWDQYCGFMVFEVDTGLGPLTLTVFNDCGGWDYIEAMSLSGLEWDFEDLLPGIWLGHPLVNWEPDDLYDRRWGGDPETRPQSTASALAMTVNERDKRVFDALIRAAESLSDDELEAECREDGEELESVAGQVRGTLLAAVRLMLAWQEEHGG